MIARTRSLFLRALGITFAIAFASLAVQVQGLLGSDGLEPVTIFLDAVRGQLDGTPALRLPSLFWISASDAALSAACLAGVVLGLLLAAGIAPFWAALGCWALYLSLVSVGQDFLRYQWDALLLETGFLGILWAPLSLRLGTSTAEPSRIVLWLLRWLLFRLMFFSGWVKLASGDPTWWNLTALAVHYETQPLPAWTSWWAHALPLLVQKASCAAMFAIELGLPLFIVLGRRARAVACAGFLLLQGMIAATGNYGFFNVLTSVLCIPLLDDAQLRGLERLLRRARPGLATAADARERSAPLPAAPTAAPGPLARAGGPLRALIALVLLASSVPAATAQLLGRRPALPAPWVALQVALEPFFLVGRYGLFAVMTTTRPEIVVEGSDDGVTWTPYVFRWKPGAVDRAPAFVEPHMPRLDWQLWFDALHVERALDGMRVARDLVVPRLVERLLDGSRPVRDLLAPGPFADRPPRWVRWQLYHYRFSDRAERARSGAWWTRRPLYESRPFAGARRSPSRSLPARTPAGYVSFVSIELDRLSRSFGAAVAVHELSLEIASGEVLVLLGGSGSGKTTTLRMINRLIEPTSGVVRIDGLDTRSLPAHELRRRIGYVFQRVGLFPHLTVAENVAVTPSLLGWDAARIRRRVDELLALVELDGADLRDRFPDALSGGQQQRVGVARALAAEPTVLLLDEPFGALDPLTRDRLQDSFERIRRELALTAVFVTHDMAEALRLGDRIAVLRDGRLVQVGTPGELLRAPADDYVRRLVETPRRQAELVDSLLGAGAPRDPHA